MKIGLGSYAFRWAFKAGMTPVAFLRQAASLGAEVVQLCENAGFDRLEPADLASLAAEARHLDLVVEGGGSGGGDRRRLEDGIRRTAAVDGILYRCVLDADGAAPQTVAANLRAVLPVLRECGVMLCAENHFRYSVATLARIVRDVDDPAIGVCLDPLNAIVQWASPAEALRELAPLARTAHVKDAVIRRSGAGFTIVGVPLGEGHADLAGFLAAVAPRVESLVLEAWMDPVDGEAGPATLAQEARWARDGLEVIRDLARRRRVEASS
jgi:sugar phosphate isomerase/epimerase